MPQYPIPARETRAEIRVLNSRFIATVAPVFSVEEARAFLASIKREFPDASHNVPAWLVGHGASVVAHCHDDGEPPGTAGRPVLSVLLGSGLGDVAVVVTRYFGGTKLGTGGLVRAYTNAVQTVLQSLPLAEKVPTHTVMLVTPYSTLERVRLAVEAHRGQILEQDFGADVTFTARIAADLFPAFAATVGELSSGSVQPLIIERDQITIMPLGAPYTSTKSSDS